MAKRKRAEQVAPEWSHMVDVREVESKPVKISIEAGPEERAALAQRAGVESIESLRADLALARDQGDLVLHVTGDLEADVTQKCVVTTEPLKNKIKENFEAWYADPAQAVSFTKARREKQLEKGGPAEFPILEEHEDPEAIVEGKIDAGELVAQYLCLAIDPYPHKEGVEFEAVAPTKAKEEAAIQKNPFAALKDWKARHGRDKS